MSKRVTSSKKICLIGGCTSYTKKGAQVCGQHLHTAILQAEIVRYQRLIAPRIFDLFGAYPALRKLLHVLAEAAELQDPSKGAPVNDTMRTEVTESSSVERALLTHRQHRARVRYFGDELERLRKKFGRDLDYAADNFSKMLGGQEWEYGLPPAPVCGVTGCRLRNRKQSYTAYRDGCEGCGRAFEMEGVR